VSGDSTVENLKGTAKEVAGEAVGDEDLERAGEAQQKKAQKQEEAERLEEEAERKEQQAAGYAGEQAKRED
jgi:uncharacterized protein YjbJ (UPF0337 family)